MRLAFCFSLIVIGNLSAQEIPLGTWRTHFSYNEIRRIEAGENQVFAAASSGMFIYSLNDNSITTVTRLNGLQEENISALHFSESATLLIGHQSGNLDVLRSNEILNIDLTTDSQVSGSKSINNILSSNDGIYLFTDFGLLRMDPETYDITETVREIGLDNDGIKVYQGAILEDSLFIATDDGILATDIVNNINLADPLGWKLFGEADNLFNEPFEFIINSGDRLLAGSSGRGIYSYNGAWSMESVLTDVSFIGARANNNTVLVTTDQGVFQLDTNLNELLIEDELLTTAQDALLFQGDIYLADQKNGLVFISPSGSESVLPSGPISSAFDLSVQSNGIYGFAGGYDDNVNPLGSEGAFYIFDNGLWTNFQENGELPAFEDAVDGAYQSSGGRTIVALAGQGLLVVNDDGSGEIIDDQTQGSTLFNTTQGEKGIIVPAVHADVEGIWVLNYNSPTPLHLWSPDNTWTAYSLVSNQPFEIVGDSRQLYIPNPNGVVVFDKSSGNNRLLTDDPGQGGLASDEVGAIAVDREGLVWIGTDRGISVLTNPFSSLEGNVDAVEPIFENRPLLRDESITAIAVDGGDRKWIGTNSGIWLFDAGADRQLLNFTVENSPLSSNEVLDIAINPKSGEVFFATPAGIISYREGATEATAVHQNVKVFPNPVTADFTGTVGISGLVEDAQIRITDASGKLIWRTRAAGGTATWNAQDYNGNRAASGVYFIFSSDDDGEETFIGKIVVVN
ncbi:MAG: T9SS type A sorting domain-containing protein [Bacteroidota bacterium]